VTPLDLLHQVHVLGLVLTSTCTVGDVPPGTEGHTRPLVFGLHVDAPKGVLTPALLDALRQHKAALLELVEAFEERAGIAEFCGGLTRDAAEALAWDCLCDHATLEVSNGW
jgi:hypothetical protein